MVATKWLRRVAIAAGSLALSTASAEAITLNVLGGGLEGGNASYGCPTGSGNCSLAQRDYSLVNAGTVDGTITINQAGTILEIFIFTAGDDFDTTPAGAPISFAAGLYQATLTNFSATSDAILFGVGTATVNGIANGIPFIVNPSVSISCNFPGGVGQCGIAFGESGFTNVEGHDWLHTFDLTVALPEPATSLLVVLGVAGLALRSRSH